MTTVQHPIPSGFSAESTTDDVLRGVSLAGRFAIVTGGYSGIGLETTRALVAAGADVLVPARRIDVAAEALAALHLPPGRVTIDALDLADLASVQAFAERVLALQRPLHLLINNAGIMACPETRVGPDGTWEAQLATNHLGHFALTGRLWPLLVAAKGARVIALTSAGHRRSAFHFEDPMFARGGYEKMIAYGQAKTANVLFAVHIDAHGQDAGVRAFSVHPGLIDTPLSRHLSLEQKVANGWMNPDGTWKLALKSPSQGAATTCWAATSGPITAHGGAYCEDSDVGVLTPDGDPTPKGVRPYAIDREQAARLWKLSADLTGIDAF